jgi:hypothetical protein
VEGKWFGRMRMSSIVIEMLYKRFDEGAGSMQDLANGKGINKSSTNEYQVSIVNDCGS